MKLENWLYKRACISGQRPALFFEGASWTFEELYRDAYAYGQIMRSYIGDGHARVAVLSNNSAQMYLTILGLQQISCEMVLLNTRLTAHELSYQLSDSMVSILLVEEAFSEVASKLAQLAPQVTVYTIEELCDKAKAYQGKEAAPTDYTGVDSAAGSGPAGGSAAPSSNSGGTSTDTSNAVATTVAHEHHLPLPDTPEFGFDRVTSILYTSGTTGNPKGVMQSFGNHWWSATASMLNLGLEPTQDSWICITPLFHISGLSIVMRSLVYGMPVYLHRKFDARLINDALCAGEGTIISVVTYHLRELIATLDGRTYHPTFRCMLLGGGFVEESLLKKCDDAQINVIQSFGMTETCSQVIALSFEDAQRKIGSAGLPLMPNAVRVVEVERASDSQQCSGQPNAQQTPRLAPRNHPGEIQLKSPALCVGYLNKEEKYRSSFTADGWFKTGDIGIIDDEGFLYIKSRLTEMIISGGENIYPSDIEHYLLTFDGIAEAAVVGHPDPVWNMVPWAYVVADDKTAPLPTDDALSRHLRGFLAGYKIPKRYIWVEELPKTATGKIEKYKLVNRAD